MSKASPLQYNGNKIPSIKTTVKTQTLPAFKQCQSYRSVDEKAGAGCPVELSVKP